MGFSRLIIRNTALALLLCASAAVADEPKTGDVLTREKVAAPDNAEVKPGLAGSFLSSRFAKRHRDLGEASKYIDETLAREPKNEKFIKEGIRVSVLSGDIAKALKLAESLPEITHREPLIASLLMLREVDAKRYGKAQKIIYNAADVGLFGVIKPVVQQWLRIAKTPKSAPVDMQEVVEKSGFFAPFLHYQQGLMNDMLGHKEAALSFYRMASADASLTPYRVVEALANFYARMGDWGSAQATYDAYAKANPDSSLLPDKLLVMGQTPTTPDALVPDARAGLAEIFFTTASILYGEEATQETFSYLRIALHLRPDFPPAQLMLANLYEQMNDYQQAINTYDSIAPGNVFQRRGQIRKALNYEALGKIRKALELLDEIAQSNPRNVSALITKGDILREQKKYSKAASAYTGAIERSVPYTKDSWPLFYARGICFERAGEWEMAERDFLKALELEPNQPDVLNYLAYSWLSMNKNIIKARDMLQVAVTARPDDAHIIDSMGWAHYLSGDYEQAVEFLERALNATPDDPAVNDHLGDAYWRVGRKIEARYQWERALKNNPEKSLRETLQQKIKTGLSPFLQQQQTLRGAPPKADASRVE